MLQKLFKRLRNKMTEKELLNEIKQRPLPEYFYRGFSSKECFTTFGYIGPGAFLFQPNTKEPRNDSYNEASINWDDDEGALTVLKTQINARTGEPQFKFGYVRIPMSAILPLVRNHIQNGHFSYERAPLVENHYHGNLLAHSDLKGQDYKLLQDGLALVATSFFQQEEEPSFIR